MWNTSLNTLNGADLGHSMTVNNNIVYLTGQFVGTPLTINNTDGTSNSALTGTGGTNAYVVEYDLNGRVITSAKMLAGESRNYGITYGAR